jgi:hypothetical protein
VALRIPRTTASVLVAFALLLFFPSRSDGQAALLLEEPYGFFGAINPTGHVALYFARICAESPLKLRRCEAGEMGSVIARYSDVAHHDWVIIPLLPYLYSVEDSADVPSKVDREIVNRLRDQYHEAHLLSLGKDLRKGDFWHGGWSELVGVTYDRRIYAIRFDTTEAQDDAFIARMNDDKNHSHFELFYNNCADFSRVVLNQYFPDYFGRSFFPDAAMTTPKQVTHKLTKYGAEHPEMHLAFYEIPQIPGYRRPSRRNKGISESLVTTAWAVPVAVLNPYLAGGLFVDYVLGGRYKVIPKNTPKLSPAELDRLKFPTELVEEPAPGNEKGAAGSGEEPRTVPAASAKSVAPALTTNVSMKEFTTTHE